MSNLNMINTNPPAIRDSHPKYFAGRYLLAEDFQAQHDYLYQRQRYCNQSLHVAGIIEGLKVTSPGKNSVSISIGSAIDSNGNLIILQSPQTLSNLTNLPECLLCITFIEGDDTSGNQQTTEGKAQSIYTKDFPQITAVATSQYSSGVILAKITIGVQGNVSIDNNRRIYSGIYLPNQDDNPITLQSVGNNINIGSTTASANLAVNGNLSVTGIITGNGNVTIGSTAANSTLSVNGDLSVTGTITGNPNVKVGSTAVNGDLSVTGTITGNPNVKVGSTAVNGDLSVTGKITNNNGNVTIGSTAANNNLSVNGDLSVKNGNGTIISTANSILSVNGDLSVTGNGNFQNLKINGGSFSFGSRFGQLINLYGTSYGIGVQRNTQYFRTASDTGTLTGKFAWYAGGSHSDNECPGTGWNVADNGFGYTLMTLSGDGLTISNTFFSGTNKITSDSRIKKNQKKSDTEQDLKTLLQIEITDYLYKHRTDTAYNPQKKVIGQQIASVYPQAVSLKTGIIPDIQQNAVMEGNWITLNNHGLKVGDTIKIQYSEHNNTYSIEEITQDRVKISLEYDGEVFVIYDQKVDDFHYVDYDALSMLNISATQALSKKIDDLQQQFDDLKASQTNSSKSQNYQVSK